MRATVNVMCTRQVAHSVVLSQICRKGVANVNMAQSERASLCSDMIMRLKDADLSLEVQGRAVSELVGRLLKHEAEGVTINQHIET